MIILLATVAACVHARGDWLLLDPPAMRDESFPRGYRLVPSTPLTDWHQVASFDTEAACEAARKRNTDDSIDRARAAYGDEAKYDLAVRRAVNARCVSRAQPDPK